MPESPLISEKLPSLRRFQPKFYTGGPTRFYLPLFYDLVALTRPRVIVHLGFGDGQAFFTLCQAIRENEVDGRCLAINRADTPDDDAAWRAGRADAQEFYGEIAQLETAPTAEAAPAGGESVDLLLIDDCDSAAIAREELAAWSSRMRPDGIVLVHGIDLDREDGPGRTWHEWRKDRRACELHAGVGLGVSLLAESASATSPFVAQLFGSETERRALEDVYELAARCIDAEAAAEHVRRANSALEMRQVWFNTILDDRWKTQEVMDDQAAAIADLTSKFEPLQSDRVEAQRILDEQAQAIAALAERARILQSDRETAQEVMNRQAEEITIQRTRFEALHTDRVKAQLVMDTQAEQLKDWVARVEALEADRVKRQAQLAEQKSILNAAKNACRKDGRCFRLPVAGEERRRRSWAERITREVQRMPRNLQRALTRPSPPPRPEVTAPQIEPAIDRYATWIAAREPSASELAQQRHAPPGDSAQTKISLIVPTQNTPGDFLDEMLRSVAAQTYPYWEICIADGGSDRAETKAALQRWQAGEPRVRIDFLGRNLGISENTNRALALATGEFVALLDHDDLLAPFALYEVARGIARSPESDIFYSDEDRWDAEGKRHSPFFKPEWSPELLYSCMYLGHLTAYRRALVEKLGGFRKQFDLSQDYDLALRATEIARRIEHIPHVLYHWREHAASGSLGGKPDARKTNLAALADAMRRRKLPAEIEEHPMANRVRMKLASGPRVSIIIPTDSPTRAQECLSKIPATTKYPSYEIVVVTNSALIESLRSVRVDAEVRFVPYDRPFNFSDKCNAGAAAATGMRVLFYNDDVEPEQADWIQNIIEPLENPEVGAVAPKLLYESRLIQHAGLVTGVRGLIGTAFHQQPANSPLHVNFAQSMRNVSALSGACLAMRRKDFLRLEGFDATNAPVSHSDVDLCFKVRAAGLRCVYTPFTTLHHAGHASLVHEEKKPQVGAQRDRSTIYLLKRWGEYVTHDPFFPDNMRDWLYADSPTPIRMSAVNDPAAAGDLDLLFISHDLTSSGAPILLLHLAQWCKAHGIFVTMMAPEDGPLRSQYEAGGIPLIIDPLVFTQHESFHRFVKDFDAVLANTIRGWPAVRVAKKEGVPVLWWLHETAVGEHFLREDAQLRLSIPQADVIFTPSERTAAVYRPFTEQPVRRIFYGIPEPARHERSRAAGARLRFLLLGSIEPRKGQDTFVEALRLVRPELQRAAEFHVVGRVMDPDFATKVDALAEGVPNLTISPAVGHRAALELLDESDVLVCASRDEAMPVTILEAMSMGKAIVSTTVGGVPEFITDGENGLLVRPEKPAELARAVERMITDRNELAALGENARKTYDECFAMDRFGAAFRALVLETIGTSARVKVGS